MLGRPARSRTGGAALVVMVATVLGAALVGAAAAPARAAGTLAVATDSVVAPATLHFGVMEPGETQSRTATLTTDAPHAAASCAPSSPGRASLAEHLTTSVEACAVAWTGRRLPHRRRRCSSTGRSAPVSTRRSRSPCPASGVAYLRVTPHARRGGTRRRGGHGDLRAAPPRPRPGDRSCAPPEPPSADAPRCRPPAPRRPRSGRRPLALVALGLTLRGWVRERRATPAGGGRERTP